MQQMRQHQSSRARADDTDLGSHNSSLIAVDDARGIAAGKGTEAGILGPVAAAALPNRDGRMTAE
jgi:hypothetical protein